MTKQRSTRSSSKSTRKTTSKKAATKRKSSTKKTDVPGTTFDEVIIDYLKPYGREMGGILLSIVAFISAIALLGFATTTALDVWTSFLEVIFGKVAAVVAIGAFFFGLYLATLRMEIPWRPESSVRQTTGVVLLLLAIMPLAHLAFNSGSNQFIAGSGGGWLGSILAQPITYLLGRPAAWILYLLLALFSVALMLHITVADIRQWLLDFSGQIEGWNEEQTESADALAFADEPPTNTKPRKVIDRKKMDDLKKQLPLRTNMPRKAEPEKKVSIKPKKRSRQLPPLDLLSMEAPKPLSPKEIEKKKAIIQKTLEDFDIAADVLDDVLIGPAITQFAIVPRLVIHEMPDGTQRKTRVRVNKIASIKQDLALALAAPRIRIQAPVPGQGIVGVEVPNSRTSIVRLGNVLNSDEFRKIRGTMGAGLGLDVSGKAVAADVAKLPHMLVAGQTGSGKSIFMNALITSLVMNNTPEDLQLVMIDPKKVELIRFNGLPHLLGKVEVEGERSIGVLRWLTTEMDDRYQKLAAVGARNITSYNQKIKQYPDANKMPYIVAFIDELADLMVQYGAELERAICRLAQMARATGIHLIVATQRPSTDVLTGLIKANFPARTSFAVASGTDSRVIIDSIGAESLLGKGDMLFLGADANSPKRIQGCLVEDDEVDKVVTFW
ncbi:MAG: DNA translocase FtsK 4TM domain-containing protein, partial [Anaerolineae bacterium]